MTSPDGGSTDVFVSYSRSDQEFVRALVAALASRGMKAWVDWAGIPPTAEWLAEIHAAIEESDSFLFVISPGSSASAMCREELAYAETLGKRIVPLNVYVVDRSALPPALADRQWIDFGDGASFDTAVDALVDALDTDLEWVRQHTHWLGKAREWERSGRDRSLLLRGSELRAAESWLTTPGAALKEPAATSLQNEHVLASRQASARRQRGLVTAVAVALLVTIALAVAAWVQRGEAVSQRQTAVSELLASASRERLNSSLDTALLLAVAAYDTRKTTAARAALLTGVRRTENVARIFRVHGPGSARSAVSRDGRTLAASTADAVTLFDVIRGARIATIAVTGPTPLALTDDGSLLAAVEGGRVVLREVSRRGEVSRLPSRVRVTNALSVAFAPARRLLAVGTSEGSIWLSDLDVDEPPTKVRSGGRTQLEVLAFDARGDTLAAGGPFGTYVIDIRGKPQSKGLRESNHVSSIAFAGSELLAVVTGQGELAVFGADAGAAICTPSHGTLSAVHADARGRLITAGRDGVIRTLASPCGKATILVHGLGSPIKTVGSVSGGKQLISADASGLAVIWDTRGVRLVERRSTGLEFATDIVHGWVEDDVVVSNMSGVRLVAPGRGTERLDASPQEAATLAAAPLGFVLAAAGPRVNVWTRRGYAPSQARSDRSAVSAALDMNGRMLALGRTGGAVELWDVQGDRRLAVLKTGGSGSVTALAFSADGRIAAGDNNGRVVIWSAEEYDRTVAQTTGSVDALAFAPSARLLAFAGGEEIVLWDVRRGFGRRLPSAGSGDVTDVAFTPGGDELVSGDTAGALRVWDIRAGQPLGEPFRLGESIEGIDIDASGSVAVVGRTGTVVRLDSSFWDIAASRSRICAIAGRALSDEEWEEAAPGLPRPRAC